MSSSDDDYTPDNPRYDDGQTNEGDPPANSGVITRNNATWMNTLVKLIVLCTRGILLDLPRLALAQEQHGRDVLTRELNRDGQLRAMFNEKMIKFD